MKIDNVEDFSDDFINQLIDDLLTIYRAKGVTKEQKDVLMSAAKVLSNIVVEHGIG